jgi:hypothetical protein
VDSSALMLGHQLVVLAAIRIEENKIECPLGQAWQYGLRFPRQLDNDALQPRTVKIRLRHRPFQRRHYWSSISGGKSPIR